jgi:hypothetical protein
MLVRVNANVICPACGLAYAPESPEGPCPACTAAAAREAADAASDGAAPPRRRTIRNLLYLGGVAVLAVGWILASQPAARGPTVGELRAVVERANLTDVPADAPTGRTVIDYAHRFVPEGPLYHGTLSDLDGYARATWTYDLAGQNVTIDHELSDEQFRDIVADVGLIERYMAVDPGAVADLTRFHVITFTVDARSPRATVTAYLVPDPPGSDEVARWLQRLDVPRVRDPPSRQPLRSPFPWRESR